MSWFKKARRPIATPAEPSRVPEGLWVKCPSCSQVLYEKDLAKNLRVCGSCSHHFRMSASQRLAALLDDAAINAVRQWEYTPTLLNGVPIRVVMTVTVNFTLQ